MIIKIPDNANKIIKILMDNEHEAYVVGGCVRDSILGKEPMDWDITTSASPLQVKELFSRTVDTGIAHGTVTVLMDKEGYEVTTYRVDGEYEDHRRPVEVVFTASLVEDLKRRDFTINAMAYNEIDGLVDMFEGMKDLDQGIIRCVGNASHRFLEDALRILRAVRFSAQLGFEIEEETKDAIKKGYQNLAYISSERIQVELTKLLISSHPDRLVEAASLGITSVILPEFDLMLATPQDNPHHQYNVGIHSIKAVGFIENDSILRWTALLHDVAKPICKKTDSKGIDHFVGHSNQGEKMATAILKRLKMDNHTIKTVERLITWHDYWWNGKADKKSVRKAASKIGVDIFDLLLKVQRADALAQSTFHQEEKLSLLDEVKHIYSQILEEEECLSLKDMNINGRQLIELGVKPGIYMGEVLQHLLDVVIDEPASNTYEILSQIVRNQYL